MTFTTKTDSDAIEEGGASLATVVIGVGSPFGDDQAGWRLVEMLRRRPRSPARLKAIDDPIKLVDECTGSRRLIIVDACRSGGRVGSLSRLHWPDPRIAARHSHSTHGVGVSDALRLAEQLGRLPPVVDIYGIEVGDCKPGHGICFEVLQTLREVEGEIADRLCEASHA
jgi:hydrogenase maturation protease